MPRRSLWAVCGVAVMLVAACGSSSASKSGRDLAAPGGASSAAAPTGAPLKMGTITAPYNVPALAAGVRAASAAINKAGGVQGRTVEVSVCDNQRSPTAAGVCALAFADDRETIATVGMLSAYGGTTNPIFEKAGLAGVGASIQSAGDYASPVVFPTQAGLLNLVGGAATMVNDLRLKKIGAVLVDPPALAVLTDFIDSYVLNPLGMKLAAKATVPLTSTDLTPKAAALSNTDGQLVAVTTDLAIGYIRAARKQGFTGPLLVDAAQLGEAQIKDALTGANQELYSSGAFNIATTGWRQMQAEATASGADPKLVNAAFATGWLGVHMFAQVAAMLPTISRATVLDATSKLINFDTQGMTAPLNCTVPGTALGGKAPRLFHCIQFTYLYKFDPSTGVDKLYAEKPQPLLGSN